MLTHKGRWKTVTSVMQRDNARIWDINGFGILPTGTTAEHPYYVTRVSEPIEFKPVKELNDSYYSTMVLPDEEPNKYSKEIWWIIGRYIADGWRVRRQDRPREGRIVFAVSDKKREEFEHRLSEANLHGTYTEERTCGKYHVCNNQLYEYLGIFGEYAYGNEYQEKHCVCHEKRPNTFITDTCQEMAETTKKKQHQPVQQSFLVCALLHSRLGKPVPAVYYTKRDSSALLKEGNVNKETPTLLESLTNRLKDIIVEDMFAENCISQQNLINTKQYITLALKKMNLILQTEQLSTIVKTSPLQENSLDFKETVQACFSELCTLSDNSKKKIDPLTFSLRTLRICLALMEDGISPDCSLKWSRGGGMMQNGKCSTLRTSEFHKTEKGASLSDILENEVPQKYFLSREQTEKIVFQ